MDGPVDDELIESYILRYTKPIQWAAWWSDMPDPKSREALGGVLFDPATESLVDLTAPTVGEAVVRVVLANLPLRGAVWLDAKRFLDTLAERVASEDIHDS